MRSLPLILALLLAGPAQASTLATEESTGHDCAGPYTIVVYVLTGTPAADAVDVAMDGRALVFRDPGGIETGAEGCTREDGILARDREADTVWCEDRLVESLSPGRDRAEADGRDSTAWCRHVARSGPGRLELLFAGERRAKRPERGTVRGRQRSSRAGLVVRLRARDDAGVMRRSELDFSRRR